MNKDFEYLVKNYKDLKLNYSLTGFFKGILERKSLLNEVRNQIYRDSSKREDDHIGEVTKKVDAVLGST